ncbi:hypothetical protein [Streptomyces sp. NBC_01445]|uniref:hypothetical protein n=1 Tax=Streptomyces sp. NBC_01445 TaxID=2903869 RepID=UPI002DD8BA4A|nr:hypothetical protein [Streptomyces sp. NBC_01445]WSE11037.1 hypothetical protein OG574_01135 [Streptomyces sp. NBC_01445]
MPSVLGLLEAREKKIREEVAQLREEAERVQAALAAAEDAVERLAGARAAVAEVLAEAPAGDAGSVRGAVAGSVVPHRADGVGVEALAAEYQQILTVLAAPRAAEACGRSRSLWRWAGTRRPPGWRECAAG